MTDTTNNHAAFRHGPPPGKPFIRGCSVCFTSYWSDDPSGEAFCSDACRSIVESERAQLKQLGFDGVSDGYGIAILRNLGTTGIRPDPDNVLSTGD